MGNLDRTSLIDSSARVGRWEMSTYFLQFDARPLFDALRERGAGPAPRVKPLLRVKLDDQLLLHLSVDDLPCGQRVHEDLELAGDGLEPRRHGPAAGQALCDQERGEITGRLAHLHDVVLANAEGRHVDLPAVDLEVAVAHQLA